MSIDIKERECMHVCMYEQPKKYYHPHHFRIYNNMDLKNLKIVEVYWDKLKQINNLNLGRGDEITLSSTPLLVVQASGGHPFDQLYQMQRQHQHHTYLVQSIPLP